MAVTTLIVEDEPLARERLRAFVASHDDLELVGEAEDGATAIELIDALCPELVLLDIELPGATGLEVLDRARHRPAVIVTTGFERYAVSAFEIGAVDFLLKPYSAVRFRTAIERVLRLRRGEESEAQGRGSESDAQERGGESEAHARGGESRAAGGAGSADAREARGSRANVAAAASGRAGARKPATATNAATTPDPAGAHRPLRRLFVPDRRRSVPLPISEIRRLEARDDYVAVYDGRRTYLIRARLWELETRLDPDDFVRIHRSHIINLNHVLAILPHEGGRLLIEMSDGSRIVASRTYSSQLRRLMG